MLPAFGSLCAFHLHHLLTTISPLPILQNPNRSLMLLYKAFPDPLRQKVLSFCTAIIYRCGLGLLPAGPPCTAFRVEHCTLRGAPFIQTRREWNSLLSHSTGDLFIRKSRGWCRGSLVQLGTPRVAACCLFMVCVIGGPSTPETSEKGRPKVEK